MLCCVSSCVVCFVPDVCAVPFLNRWILLCFFVLFLLCVLMTCGWTVGTKKVWRNADQATMPSFFLFFGCSFRFLSFLCPFHLALSSDCFLPLCSMYYDIYVNNKIRVPQNIQQNIFVCVFGIVQQHLSSKFSKRSAGRGVVNLSIF